jgi:hypothetical protein
MSAGTPFSLIPASLRGTGAPHSSGGAKDAILKGYSDSPTSMRLLVISGPAFDTF